MAMQADLFSRMRSQISNPLPKPVEPSTLHNPFHNPDRCPFRHFPGDSVFPRGRNLRIVAAGDAVGALVQEKAFPHNNGPFLVTTQPNEHSLAQINSVPDPAFRERFIIRCYEVGTNRRASIESIANLMQEVACNQVKSLGFSTDGFATTFKMRKLGLIWVTTRMHIQIDEYPHWGNMVECVTWFQESRFGTRRDWLITDVKTGNVIGRATSNWVMMNQDTRRVTRMTEELREDFTRYGMNPPRWAFPAEHEIYTLKSLPKLENPTSIQDGLKSRRGDLDMNQHVNNVTYIGWMLESLPPDTLSKYELKSITLDFRRECKHDETVQSMLSPTKLPKDAQNENSGPQFLHLLTLSGTNIEINRGSTEWRVRAAS